MRIIEVDWKKFVMLMDDLMKQCESEEKDK